MCRVRISSCPCPVEPLFFARYGLPPLLTLSFHIPQRINYASDRVEQASNPVSEREEAKRVSERSGATRWPTKQRTTGRETLIEERASPTYLN